MSSEYYYCMVRTKLIEYDDMLIPDLPCSNHSFVGVYEGGKLTNGTLTILSNANKEVLAYIHVKEEDKQTIQNFDGFIGDTKEQIISYSDYTLFYPYTVRDLKNVYDDEGNLIEEYNGPDALEPALFCNIN